MTHGYYYIAPFYRFEYTGQEDWKVSISIKCDRGGANFYEDFATPNRNFLAKSPCPAFIYQQTVNQCLLNGALVLSIEIKIEKNYASEDLCDNIMKQKSKIMKDLNAFIGERKTSDFTYRVDDQEFPVHKMMLSG